MGPPSGFEKQKAPKNPVAPSFVSAFDNQDASSSSSSITSRSRKIPQFRVPPMAVSDHTGASSKNSWKPLNTLYSTEASDLNDLFGSTAHAERHGKERPKSTTSSTMRIMKGKVNATPPRLQTTFNDKRIIPITLLRPIVKSTDDDPTKNDVSLHRQPQPILASSNKTVVPLKAIAPPLLRIPTTRSSPGKEMKTISTTRVARAIEFAADGVHSDLFSISLEEHIQNPTPPANRELHRGILISPEKGGKGKNPKFIR